MILLKVLTNMELQELNCKGKHAILICNERSLKPIHSKKTNDNFENNPIKQKFITSVFLVKTILLFLTNNQISYQNSVFYNFLIIKFKKIVFCYFFQFFQSIMILLYFKFNTIFSLSMFSFKLSSLYKMTNQPYSSIF